MGLEFRSLVPVVTTNDNIAYHRSLGGLSQLLKFHASTFIHDLSKSLLVNTNVRETVKRKYLISEFLCDRVEEVRCSRIHGHRKHHVLPDQDSKLISQIVKIFRFKHLPISKKAIL